MYTIYIPSKGRATNCLTAERLEDTDIKYYIVVEPQDYDSYLSRWWPEEKLLVMPENNMGLSYARRFIKKFSIDKGEEYHWQIDDNVKNFVEIINKKKVKVTPHRVLGEVERYTNLYSNIAVAGPRYTVFAVFAPDTPFSINKQVSSCFLIKNLPEFWWRDHSVEDTDYAMQVLTAGWCTLLFNKVTVDKASPLTMKGGCSEIQYTDKGLYYQETLMNAWPGIFEKRLSKHVWRSKPSRIWSTFKQVPILK